MERRRLTKEDVEGAETYIPLAEKYAAAQLLASGCVERAEGMPPVWQRNVIGYNLVKTYILTGFYLHITDISGLNQETPDFQFTVEDYDRLSGLARELNQDGELFQDYREFLDILDQETANLLARRNDLLVRLGELASVGLTPETFQALKTALEEAKGEDET